MVTGSGRVQTGLGGPEGLGEVALPRSDDAAQRQDWSAVFGQGLNFFGRRWSASDVFVNTNGTLSFGAALPAYPGAALPATGLPDLIAPFWADVDTRLRGEGRESGAIHVDIDPVAARVSVTWDDVGAYRRDTDTVNRFQIQLYDRGNGDFDIVFRYEAIAWTIGSSSADTGAQAFLTSPRLVDPLLLLPGALPATLATLDSRPGNTGITGLWLFEMRGGTLAGITPASGRVLNGTAAPEVLAGGARGDILRGFGGADRLDGAGGNDSLFGGAGRDTLSGGGGNDDLRGGDSAADLGDLILGGTGNDRIDGGYGDDLLFGAIGRDSLEGGYGADQLSGQDDADLLSGGIGPDRLRGGAGDDFLNGGPGNDRMTGGTGADRFYRVGRPSHGTDWVLDYLAAEGDTLIYATTSATPGQFRLSFAIAPDAGDGHVAEAFILWRPTGQVLWALVDGAAQPEINLGLGGVIYDLLS